MSEKDEGNKLAIIECCEKIQRFTKDFENADALFCNIITFDAVLMNFVVIGESVSRVSDSLKNENEQIPWMKIKSFRNLVAHDYFGIDAEEVWQVSENDVPSLNLALKNVIE